MTAYASLSDTTIAAIATARGAAGVAVIRLSGPDAWHIARRLFSRPDTAFEAGRFYHGWIVEGTAPVDEVLLLIFKNPQSFTGEDVVEIHCHGGDAVTHKILSLCISQGALPAEPGEFTRRAFLNGKMDLTQAESVLDLVSASNERLVALASSNLRNRSLGQYIDDLSHTLLDVQSCIVASVDFPDEVDEPDRAEVAADLYQLILRARSLMEASQRNRLVREGLKIAILGMPNAGKSSLFNALLARERAIVTEIAGTTRDVITESLSVQGVPVELIDTAGIREGEETVEILGIERSWQAAEEAQAVLYVVDGPAGITPEDQRILAKLQNAHRLIVVNKADMLQSKSMTFAGIENPLPVSAKTGEGLSDVFAWLEGLVSQVGRGDEALAVSLNHRQLSCLESMTAALGEAGDALKNKTLPIDVVTVPLTDALRKLDELMGRDTTEEVLDSVFRQFCVGK